LENHSVPTARPAFLWQLFLAVKCKIVFAKVILIAPTITVTGASTRRNFNSVTVATVNQDLGTSDDPIESFQSLPDQCAHCLLAAGRVPRGWGSKREAVAIHLVSS